jgi:hypothetical protein
MCVQCKVATIDDYVLVNAVMADVYEVLAVCLLASPVDVISYILDVHENAEVSRGDTTTHAHNPARTM